MGVLGGVLAVSDGGPPSRHICTPGLGARSGMFAWCRADLGLPPLFSTGVARAHSDS